MLGGPDAGLIDHINSVMDSTLPQLVLHGIKQ